MNTLADQVSLAVASGAVLIAAMVFVATRHVRPAVQVLLDLLLAAGLIRLTFLDTWAAIASVALLLALRVAAGTGIRQASAARHA